jgi:NADH:ubiquinone oxidoreductase subunit 2 (subunit N)
LFFQFWSNFFSTVLILLSLLIFFYIFNSTEWVWIQYFYLISSEINYLDNNIYYIYILVPFLIGVFFKLGVSPLHLYKIEVYKGLPFLTIFFYTTYFFFAFVTFFLYTIVVLLSNFSNYWLLFLSIIFVVGSILLVALLFDVQYVKAFFAYSTIVNIILIFLLAIIYFNT